MSHEHIYRIPDDGIRCNDHNIRKSFPRKAMHLHPESRAQRTNNMISAMPYDDIRPWHEAPVTAVSLLL